MKTFTKPSSAPPKAPKKAESQPEGPKHGPAPSSISASAESVGSSASRARRPPKHVQEARAKPLQWYLEFENPPGSAEIQHGPIPFDVLSDNLVLDEETVDDVSQ